MGITELVELVRRGLARDAADIEQAWQVRGFNSERLTTMQGTTVLMSGWRAHREVAAKRQLLDHVLAWPHRRNSDNDWYSCSQARDETGDWACTNDSRAGRSCTCGRDARVLQVLQLLAQPYQETEHG